HRPTGGIELAPKRHANGLVGAGPGLAVEQRAIAPRLRGVAQPVAERRAVERSGALVSDFRLAAEKARGRQQGGQQRGSRTEHGRSGWTSYPTPLAEPTTPVLGRSLVLWQRDMRRASRATHLGPRVCYAGRALPCRPGGRGGLE